MTTNVTPLHLSFDQYLSKIKFKRIDNKVWRASAGGRSVSFLYYGNDERQAIVSFFGWADWPLEAPMPRRINQFLDRLDANG